MCRADIRQLISTYEDSDEESDNEEENEKEEIGSSFSDV
jgi:hypothetical protein